MSEHEERKTTEARTLFCPSAMPQMPNSIVLATVDQSSGAPHEPHVTYLGRALPVTGDVLEQAGRDGQPTDKLRFAAPCAQSRCHHWSGSHCRVAEEVVRSFPEVDQEPPACRLRPVCRWWEQEGVAACTRCSQVVTTDERLIAAFTKAQRPAAPAAAPAPAGRVFSATIFDTVSRTVAGGLKPLR